MSPPRNAAYVYVPEDVAPQLPRLYSAEDDSNPTVWLKLFTPDSIWTWYVIEWDGDDLCFGLVIGHAEELGYFSLSEIAGVRGGLGLPVERDIYFTPCPLSSVRARTH